MFLHLCLQSVFNRRLGISYRSLPLLRTCWAALLTQLHAICTRLFATLTPEAGAWLNAFPQHSAGLRMDNNTVRIATGLRLGALLCLPHLCHHCGSSVASFAMHGHRCRYSEGRHSALNYIICRFLVSARGPSLLI